MQRLGAPIRWLTSSSVAHSLRFRLILLVLLASLPSFALLFLTASQQRADAVAAGKEEAQGIAGPAVDNLHANAEQIELVLRTLAAREELQSPERCTGFLQTLPLGDAEPAANAAGTEFRVENANLRSVSVANGEGSLVCAGPTGGSQLDAADRRVVTRALNTSQVALGNVRADAEGAGLIITYAYPAASGDAPPTRAIVVTFEVTVLSAFARQATLPPDAFIMVFDSEGKLQQRYPPAPEQGGQPLQGTPVVDRTIERDPDRELAPEDTEIDGEPYIYATEELWFAGSTDATARGFVLVAFPEDVVVQRAEERFNENLGKLAIAGVVALIAAWIGADLFVARDSETRKALIRDLYHAFSTGSLEELDDILSPSYVDRTPNPGQANGPDGLKQNIAAFRAAFPDGEILPRELLADRDKVVARVTLTGTHLADYFGMRPSGKPVTADGVETFRFADGMVVESWSLFGEMRPMRQVRAVTPERPVEPAGRRRPFWRRRRLEPKRASAD